MKTENVSETNQELFETNQKLIDQQQWNLLIRLFWVDQIPELLQSRVVVPNFDRLGKQYK
jgi:hypothetical protein